MIYALGMAILLSLNTASAKEKCKIIVTTEDGYQPMELAISTGHPNLDDKDNRQTITLENGSCEGVLESDYIERYDVSDIGASSNI